MTDLMDVSIEHAVFVCASAQAVYAGIATAQGLDGWFTEGAQVDARNGGKITFRWREWGPDDVSAEDGGPVLEAVPGRRFVFQWHPDSPDYATTVEINFESVDNGTIVRLCESGYQDTPSGRAAFANCAAGWGEALTLLKFFIEYGIRYAKAP